MTPVNSNVARYLPQVAKDRPEQIALQVPATKPRGGHLSYRAVSFAELEELSNAYAKGMSSEGIGKGTRVLLMVRPGLEMIALSFSLFKIGAVPILIDPGMGIKNMLSCISHSQPEVLLGIPLAHGLSKIFKKPFSSIRRRITVGRKLIWGGTRLKSYEVYRGQDFPMIYSGKTDLAAILFTSGSTGPPKGVRYEHGQFEAQVRLLREVFSIQPGEVDLPMLPIFALFNPALGMTTVIPYMNPSRPAAVKPEWILEAIDRFKVTNSFGSPVLWKKITRHCKRNHLKIPHLKRVLMAGAPVSPSILKDFYDVAESSEAYTPYGATEALPLTVMDGREILRETSELTKKGRGMCVGKPVPGIEVLVEKSGQTSEDDVIGEVVVSGDVVTRAYDRLPKETEESKIYKDDMVWHRMGDMGYFDDSGRLWFCGRKSHRVISNGTTYYSVCCEAIFNEHPFVYRSALVSLKVMRSEMPAIVVELEDGAQINKREFALELLSLARSNPVTRKISTFFIHPAFPVDVRHNAKIDREKLSEWARQQKRLDLPVS